MDMTIHEAAADGDATALRVLLESGVDINARDGEGRTALFHADTAETARFLINSGADVHAVDDKQRTALSRASDPDVAAALLDAGADIEHDDDPGDQRRHAHTPLVNALECEYYDVARLLVQRGADVSLYDSNAMTLLHLAAQAPETDIAEMMLERGVIDINDRKNIVGEPIMAFAGTPEMVQLLHDAGLDLYAACDSQWTAFHTILWRMDCAPEFVDVLLRLGVSAKEILECVEPEPGFTERVVRNLLDGGIPIADIRDYAVSTDNRDLIDTLNKMAQMN